MNADVVVPLFMLGVFIVIAAVMIAAKWYTKKYKSKLNFTQIIIGFFIILIFSAYYFIKNLGSDEKQNIIENVTLKTTVANISLDSHKPYFKDMTLADGQHLPMPEAMNTTLQVNDSIYKNKGENFYTVINAKTKIASKYEVKIHERILSKPQ